MLYKNILNENELNNSCSNCIVDHYLNTSYMAYRYNIIVIKV